jgi:hypothetical protein
MDPWIQLGYQASALSRPRRHIERLPRRQQVRNRYKNLTSVLDCRPGANMLTMLARLTQTTNFSPMAGREFERTICKTDFHTPVKSKEVYLISRVVQIM